MTKSGQFEMESDAVIPESDRLGEWPHPRETRVLYGHGLALEELKRNLQGGHMPHGWLISGPGGIGKATFAYHLAREVLNGAVNGGGIPAAEQPHREHTDRLVAALSHPRLFVLRRPWQAQAQKFGMSIPIAEIRRLRHFLTTTAGEGWRVVIVDSADDLNVNSVNALLKSLEEPPPRTLFLLVSASPGRLPPTLISRCARVRLRPLSASDMTAAVRAAFVAIDREPPGQEQLQKLLAVAKGSPRRALELAEGQGLRVHDLLQAIFSGLPRVDYASVHHIIEMLGNPKSGIDEAFFLQLLQDTLHASIRDALVHEHPAHGMAAQMGITHRHGLALWGELWETVSQMRAEAERLNLDRAAVVLTIFAEIERTARQAAALSR